MGSCESTELEKHFPLFALVVVPAVSREKHVLLRHLLLLLPLLRNFIFFFCFLFRFSLLLTRHFGHQFVGHPNLSLTSSNQNCLLTRRRFRKETLLARSRRVQSSLIGFSSPINYYQQRRKRSRIKFVRESV